MQATQDIVAATAGLSRQTTNQRLGDLQDAGVLVVRRGQIVLQDPARLETIAAGGMPQAPVPRQVTR